MTSTRLRPPSPETFRRWVKDFYQRDKLVRGQVDLRGRRVVLSNIGCSMLNVSGEWDYGVPTSQTKATGHPRQQPGQGVRLPGRRARGHARRAGRRGPLGQGSGLAYAPL